MTSLRLSKILFEAKGVRAAVSAASLASMFLSMSAHAFTLNTQPELKGFADAVVAKLPPALIAQLPESIDLRFEYLDRNAEITPPHCSTDSDDVPIIKQRLGVDQVFHAKQITLNGNFAPILLAGPTAAKKYDCGHRDLYRLAMATAIHEIGHIYDHAGILKGKISGDPQFLHLMTFAKKWSLNPFTGFRSWKQLSENYERSPDPYEFKNSKETFAVNLEYFLMDEEYACREPAMHQFYSNLFEGFDPYPKRACGVNYSVPLYSPNALAGFQGMTSLDPSRIYEIDYLFAGRGKALMSKWGHAMFRIVGCSPKREKVGPECLQDVDQHVIIGFSAGVASADINYLKGLFGGYHGGLFFYPWKDVSVSYSSGELRDLFNYPIQMNESQKKMFVELALQRYYIYSSKYFFLTNNCATEAEHLLQSVLPEKTMQRIGSFTPLGLLNTMKKKSLVDATTTDSESTESIQEGFFVPSEQDQIDKAFAMIQSSSGEFTTQDAYLKSSEAPDRKAAYEAWKKSGTHTSLEIAQMSAAYYFMESKIEVDAESQILKYVMNELSSDGDDSSLKGACADAHHSIQELLNQSASAVKIVKGYGIPSVAEVNDALTIRSDSLGDSDLNKNVDACSAQLLPEGTATNARILANMSEFSAGILEGLGR